MDKQTLQTEIDELVMMRDLIDSEVFQKFIAKPMSKAKKKLTAEPHDFFVNDVKESWRKGGKLEGIEVYMKLIEGIHVDLKTKLYELEGSSEGQ